MKQKQTIIYSSLQSAKYLICKLVIFFEVLCARMYIDYFSFSVINRSGKIRKRVTTQGTAQFTALSKQWGTFALLR